MICQSCNNAFFSVKILDSLCPVCGGHGLGQVSYYQFTDSSYGISFADFKQLLGPDMIYSDVKKSVAGWLQCEISHGDQGQPLLKHKDGFYIPLLAAHLKIQLDKKWQQSIYNMGMAIWR